MMRRIRPKEMGQRLSGGGSSLSKHGWRQDSGKGWPGSHASLVLPREGLAGCPSPPGCPLTQSLGAIPHTHTHSPGTQKDPLELGLGT